MADIQCRFKSLILVICSGTSAPGAEALFLSVMCGIICSVSAEKSPKVAKWGHGSRTPSGDEIGERSKLMKSVHVT